ncbi:unnamed protein product [Callosobruchus maculatus]|uniref:NADP-dependent oxidoreductase domain-containing protein n=1 Tax=Callosobruchus maculatus TaxID=64391 RepID=A0A653CCF1_CALMS|nr:unnamed protein product [Callosobruchus maculatus]
MDAVYRSEATDEDSLTAAVHEALKLGYRHIDTASAYDNEHVIGKVLKEWFDEGKLTQKVEKFLRRSLEALQLDYVDMYLIHVPFTVVEHVGPNGQPFAGFKEDGTVYMDESTDLVAIWKEFEKFQRQGLTRSIGVSDFNINQIERILKNCEIRPSNHQFEYHAALQVDDMVSFCKDNDIVCTGYATLGSAAASSFAEVPGLLYNSTVVEIAEKHKKTAAQVLLRHSLQKGLVVIPKSTNLERVKENFEIFDFELDDEDMDALAGLDCNFRIYNFESLFKGHIDTASGYYNEHVIGKVLKEWFDEGKLTRDEIFVTTKLPGYGNVPEKVEKFLRRSLEALQLDYVDMYLIHVPFTLVEHVGPNGQPCVGFKEDGTVDMDESTDLVAIWKEFEKFQRQGLTRSIGVSDFNMNQIERILKNCEIRPSNHQFEYHAALQVDDMVSFCKDNDIVCTGYATLGSGAASSFAEVPGLLNNSTVVEIAEKHKKTAAQVLRHSVQKGLVVIPKSTNPERVKENFEIFDFELDDEDMDALAGLDCNFRIYDFEQYFFKGIKNHPEYPY